MKGRAKLARNDLGERRLAKPWGADEEDMVECLAAGFCSFDEDIEIFAQGLLANEIGKHQGAHRRLCVISTFLGR